VVLGGVVVVVTTVLPVSFLQEARAPNKTVKAAKVKNSFLIILTIILVKYYLINIRFIK
jgi:hypothetical protein